MSHLTNLVSLLGGGNPSALLVTSEINQRYISRFAYSDGYLLLTRDASYLLTDFRYAEAAAKEADRALTVLAPEGGMLNFMAGLLGESGCASLSFEEATLPYAALEKIKAALPGVNLVPGASALIDGLREIKDDEEFALTDAAQKIADSAYSHILGVLNPNMTEREVALELEFFMRRAGAEEASFDTIAVSGSASSMPHGVPREVKLERGFLTMDFGARVGGYCSDMTRTVALGRADAEMKRLYATVLCAQNKALEAVREGSELREVDRVARDIINEAGYAGCFGHGLGHGVGMHIHESPRLSPAAPAGERLRAGQIVTVEPGIYIAGCHGCRIEDMVYVTSDGCLNFTRSPKELIELF